MAKKMRLDKVLSNIGHGTRSEIKKKCRQGLVTVNGKEQKKSDIHVDPEVDVIEFEGEVIRYREFVYLMLNKPDGYISATRDKHEQTVMELIDGEFLVFEPFPVGRLDKDTEGLLILTNDGKLSYNVLSPKKHVPKKYYAVVDGKVTNADVKKFEKGVKLDDGYVTKPAKLEIVKVESAEDYPEIEAESGIESEIELVICEGKFHQVKRMFEAVGKKVTYLQRIQMGGLKLDESLEIGKYRELTEDEIQLMQQRECD